METGFEILTIYVLLRNVTLEGMLLHRSTVIPRGSGLSACREGFQGNAFHGLIGRMSWVGRGVRPRASWPSLLQSPGWLGRAALADGSLARGRADVQSGGGQRRTELGSEDLCGWRAVRQGDELGRRRAAAVVASRGRCQRRAAAAARRRGLRVHGAGPGQGGRHPAGVGVAQDQALLGAGVRDLLHGRLHGYLCGCEGGRQKVKCGFQRRIFLAT